MTVGDTSLSQLRDARIVLEAQRKNTAPLGNVSHDELDQLTDAWRQELDRVCDRLESSNVSPKRNWFRRQGRS